MTPRVCLLIHTGSKSAAYIRTHALVGLRSLAAAQGLREVTASEHAQRVFAVAPASSAPWVAVELLHEGGTDAETLAEFCCSLSESLLTPVLGALLQSGQTLYLCLGDEGSVVNEFCTEPTFFGEDAQWQQALEGDSGPWGHVLRSADPAALMEWLEEPGRASVSLLEERATLRDALLAQAPADVARALDAIFAHPSRSAEEQLRRLAALLRFEHRAPSREPLEKLEERGYTLLRLAPAPPRRTPSGEVRLEKR